METTLPGSKLGSDIQAKIGQHLRAMYDDVVRQGVPDRFLDLLSRLDEPAAPVDGSAPNKRNDGGHR
ncbi:NepR family anti-sigma factor [Ancylobacter sp. G4_0304]|uniref:NepR family anti-sigma factor n=1 Tax=Ancylobacter sp. G4_0304 TaxID=3114289 RepID=UPI0039C613A2